MDYITGDGKLRYGTENVWKNYYNAKLFSTFVARYHLQRVSNPAINRVRGPVWVSSLRLHFELGKETFP